MKNNAVSKIRLLKDIQPNPDWLKSQRSNLLFEISESGNKAKSAWKLPAFILPNFAFKPVLVSLTLFGLIFGGGMAVVLASKDSLPGDLLYPFKIAIENTRVKVSSQETKPELQAEFVGNRVEELTQIIKETKDPIEKKEKVVKAVNELQAQVVRASVQLEATGVVSEKNDQAEKALIEAKEKIVEEFKGDESEEIAQAIEVIDAALAVILATKKARDIEGTQAQVEVIRKKSSEVEEIEGPIVTFPMIILPEASESFEKIYDE